MAKRKVGSGERPKPAEVPEPPPTKMIRVHTDMAEMMGWIARLKGGTIAQLVDRIARSEVEHIYGAIKASVDEIKRIEGESQG